MSKWKKTYLAIKVFLPILIKGILELWNQIMEAYEENNLKQLHETAEIVEELAKEKTNV